MKKSLVLVSLCYAFLLSGCFSSKPKCDNEDVLLTLKQILNNDEWVYIEYGLTKQSLQSINSTLNAVRYPPILRAYVKSLSDLRDFANEFVYTSFGNFITQSNNDDKKTFCTATLKLTYPQMPEDMKKNIFGGSLKGVIFDGGEVEKQINYSTQYTDDKKQVYVEWLK